MNQDLKNYLDKLFPFLLLCEDEKVILLNEATLEKSPESTILCTQNDYDDRLFLLYQGTVNVVINGITIGTIQAPAYFGELTVFFSQPRKATIISANETTCLVVNGSLLRTLINNNLRFCYGFGSLLRNKQKIFLAFDRFINLLFSKQIQEKFNISDIIPAYKRLLPILHRHCRDEMLDFFALRFVVSKLPKQLTRIDQIELARHLPKSYQIVEDVSHFQSKKISKQVFYEVFPGKFFILLRDDTTDYIDVITKFCLYLIEIKKIVKRLQKSPNTFVLLEKNYFQQLTEAEKDDLLAKLPFSEDEITQLKQIFPENLLNKLYEIFFQNEIHVKYISASVRYYIDSVEKWSAQIKDFFHNQLQSSIHDQAVNIHVISSNTHSVINCLSPWIHDAKNLFLTDGPTSTFENPADEIYANLAEKLREQPELRATKKEYELEQGIYYLPQNYLTGIDVSVIDLEKLKYPFDPYLMPFQPQKKTILFNIDYAYGKQAELIIRNLILLFGKKIKSISVFGKAGSIFGKRGELVLPTYFIMQENDVTYTIPNADLTMQHLLKAGCQRKIHTGAMLTVLGTLMQNHEMLMFYQNFWKAQGMEMEGGYFLQEINRASMRQLLDPHLKLRFAYYISDAPLDVTASLAKRLSITEGLPAVYAITRAILRRIFEI